MIGMGAMLHTLRGGSDKSAENYIGRKIRRAKFVADEFSIEFDDGVKIKITDEGQSCCENRYMTCDDKPSDLDGKILTAIRVKEVKDEDKDYECHEICFLEVQAEEVFVTFATHNEHNGYYGGFGLNIKEVD